MRLKLVVVINKHIEKNNEAILKGSDLMRCLTRGQNICCLENGNGIIRSIRQNVRNKQDLKYNLKNKKKTCNC